MEYVSTRGASPPMDFRSAVMEGLARDGGLLLPGRLPSFAGRLPALRAMRYADLAVEVMRPFCDLPEGDLVALVRRGCAAFSHPEVTPVVSPDGLHILELFHGPTLSFKDIALQFLGNLFEYILRGTGGELNILVATSGDTGSAAIQGVRGRSRMRIFVLHPRGRVSLSQERQMTTVPAANVFNIAVEGTFDDCQRMVKGMLGDLEFKRRCSLGAVNSINWARVLAQTVYYFYAAFRVMDATGAGRVAFAVPTGNFGDVLAGYLAVKMGLPAGRLVLATNENDILARFFRTGTYSVGEVRETASPAMDIQVASNFERYLYYRVGCDPERVGTLMREFGATGRISLPPLPDGDPGNVIVAGAARTDETLATIREVHSRTGYLLDPHTAVGVFVSRQFAREGEPMICLATAHPAKFSETIRKATGCDIAHHAVIDALTGLPAKCRVLPAAEKELRAYIEAVLAA